MSFYQKFWLLPAHQQQRTLEVYAHCARLLMQTFEQELSVADTAEKLEMAHRRRNDAQRQLDVWRALECEQVVKYLLAQDKRNMRRRMAAEKRRRLKKFHLEQR